MVLADRTPIRQRPEREKSLAFVSKEKCASVSRMPRGKRHIVPYACTGRVASLICIASWREDWKCRIVVDAGLIPFEVAYRGTRDPGTKVGIAKCGGGKADDDCQDSKTPSPFHSDGEGFGIMEIDGKFQTGPYMTHINIIKARLPTCSYPVLKRIRTAFL